MGQGDEYNMAGKLIGSVLVLISCFFMGYRYSIREKLRLDELLFFKSSVIKIMSELEYGRVTFCEALAAADTGENEIFQAIYNAVKNNNGIKTAWKYAFEENGSDSYMTREDMDRLSVLGEGFGAGDIELQKKYVNNAVDYINSSESIILSKLEKDKKVYRSVSITIGLFIVILLL